MHTRAPSSPCPDCGAALPSAPAACAACQLPLVGPTAARLWEVDQALAALGAERRSLLVRLRSEAAPLDLPAPAGVLVPSQAAPTAVPAPTLQRREWTPKQVQNLLLGLGAGLLAVAAIVFCAVSWDRLGTPARTGIMLLATVSVAAGALELRRRRLVASAEALASLGVVLALVDVWAARRLGLGGLDLVPEDVYWLGGTTLLAALSAAYAALSRLGAPQWGALLLAQFPLLLLASVLEPALPAWPVLLLVQGALLVLAPRALPVRPEVALASSYLALLALAGGVLAAADHAASPLALPSGVGFLALFAASPLLLALAHLERRPLPQLLAVASPLPWVTGAAVGLDRAGLDVSSVVVVASAGALLVAASRLVTSRFRQLCAAGAAATLLPALVLLSSVVMVVALSAFEVSSSLPSPRAVPLDSAAALVSGVQLGEVALVLVSLLATLLLFPDRPAALRRLLLRVSLGVLVVGAYALAFLAGASVLVLALSSLSGALLALAGAAFLARTHGPLGTWVLPAALLGGWALAWGTVDQVLLLAVLAPLALAAGGVALAPRRLVPATGALEVLSSLVTGVLAGSALWVGLDLVGVEGSLLALLLLGFGGLLLLLALARRSHRDALGWVGASALLASSSTILVPGRLGVLTVVVLLASAGAVATALRSSATRSLELPSGLALLAGAVLTAGAGLLLDLVGLSQDSVGLLLLVPVGALLALALHRRTSPDSLGWEGSAALGSVSVLSLAAADLTSLSVAAGALGVLAAAHSLRSDRRGASYVAAVLFTFASWVRLVDVEVSVPEAYAAPVALVALALGVLRLRRDQDAGSWSTLGSGLGALVLPTALVLLGGDGGLTRPLGLGVLGAGLVLAGARWRLQAPLVAGALALLVVAFTQLGPVVVSAPRWLTLGLLGALLFGVGSTYERRRRDFHRVTRTVSELR